MAERERQERTSSLTVPSPSACFFTANCSYKLLFGSYLPSKGEKNENCKGKGMRWKRKWRRETHLNDLAGSPTTVVVGFGSPPAFSRLRSRSSASKKSRSWGTENLLSHKIKNKMEGRSLSQTGRGLRRGEREGTKERRVKGKNAPVKNLLLLLRPNTPLLEQQLQKSTLGFLETRVRPRLEVPQI